MPGTRPAIRDHHDHVIVTLCGELDIADAACLRDALTGAVTRNPHVVADLPAWTSPTARSSGPSSEHGDRPWKLAGTWCSPGRGGKPGGFSSCRS
jgi:hypothetical protein